MENVSFGFVATQLRYVDIVQVCHVCLGRIWNAWSFTSLGH